VGCPGAVASGRSRSSGKPGAASNPISQLLRWGTSPLLNFHAFRHTLISNLAQGGVHPKTGQELARDSTITLTMDRYTHTTRTASADAPDALPNLRNDASDRKALRERAPTHRAGSLCQVCDKKVSERR